MRTLLTLGLLLTLQLLWAQSLDAYVQRALEQNFGLQEQESRYAQAQARLAQARALFWPRLSVEGRYSAAAGGRAFEIPVGDLVNPAYQNLNAINRQLSGGDPSYPAFPNYPMIENQSENFLRATEQETVVRLEMPLYNAAISRSRDLRENLLAAEGAGVEQYRRQLRRDVEQAYYRYAQALAASAIYAQALQVVDENLRTTQRLRDYEKATAAEVYGAQAQVAQVKQQLAMAEQQQRTAQAYFNTLLNRPYEATISLPDTQLFDLRLPLDLAQAEQRARQSRPELRQLHSMAAASEQQQRLAAAQGLPSLNLRADYGIQGTTYAFGPDDDFFLGSLTFRIPLFDRSTKLKVREAELGRQAVDQQLAAVRQQIGLQVLQQYYTLQATHERISQAKAERAAAAEAFRLISKRYDQGQSSQLAFFDARTRLTNAEQQLLIARYDWLIQQAEWQYVTGN
jgi:outer membrane protein